MAPGENFEHSDGFFRNGQTIQVRCARQKCQAKRLLSDI